MWHLESEFYHLMSDPMLQNIILYSSLPFRRGIIGLVHCSIAANERMMAMLMFYTYHVVLLSSVLLAMIYVNILMSHFQLINILGTTIALGMCTACVTLFSQVRNLPPDPTFWARVQELYDMSRVRTTGAIAGTVAPHSGDHGLSLLTYMCAYH